MQLPPGVAEALGRVAYEFSRIQPFIPTYIHIIASAVLPIYAGAHSSLSRPSSAAERDKAKKKDHGDESEDEEDEPRRMEGLSTSDAILFPILAGCTLAALYFIIKWLEDPAILNKILNWYFATFSVFAVSKLVSDCLDVVHSVLLPRNYIDRGILFRVHTKSKLAIPSTPGASTRSSPLPGVFSRIPFPSTLSDFLWLLKALPSRRVQFKGYVRSLLDVRFRLGIHGLIGLLVGISTVIWYNFVSKPWFLANVMGFGFAYNTLQILSPTTFKIGSLILSGLFFYDIYFVFFTPMMVTVAKSLDIPVKLLFPRPPEADDNPQQQSLSMLGLGDIVLPGIIIGLALRYDLYLFYLKKQRKSNNEPRQTRSSPRLKSRSPASPSTSSSKSENTNADSNGIIKAPYKSVAGGWGDRLWTFRPSIMRSQFSRATTPVYTSQSAFPKTYFHACLLAYIFGMALTLVAMHISGHGQPALLYLVPCVLTALWGTGFVNGEIGELSKFSDASEEEDEEDKDASKKTDKSSTAQDGAENAIENANDQMSEKTSKTQDGDAKQKSKSKSTSIFSKERDEARSRRIKKALAGDSKDDEGESEGKDRSNGKESDKGKWFAFSVKLPTLSVADSKPLQRKTEGKEKKGPRYSLRSSGSSPGWTDEHAEKRQRLS